MTKPVKADKIMICLRERAFRFRINKQDAKISKKRKPTRVALNVNRQPSKTGRRKKTARAMKNR